MRAPRHAHGQRGVSARRRRADAASPLPEQSISSDECLTYGGADPLQPEAGFYTCNNHGTWNATAFNCTCDAGWAVTNTSATGLFGEWVFGCTSCLPWLGPPPPDPGACSAPWTPDPQDGVLKTCAGHGAAVGGACFCYANATGGYWALHSLDGAVESCFGCAAGYYGSNCTSTQAPTAAPTQGCVAAR